MLSVKLGLFIYCLSLTGIAHVILVTEKLTLSSFYSIDIGPKDWRDILVKEMT